MTTLDLATCWARLAGADHGVLATIGRGDRPHVVPVCFVVVDRHVAVPVDAVKPKSSTTLQRNRNVAATGIASLLVEHWDGDDWSSLWWVRADLGPPHDDGLRRTAERELRTKYEPYRDTIFAAITLLHVDGVTGWAATPPA